MSSALTRSSLSLHVNVKQNVEVKHPVGVHVFVGLQVQCACSYTAREFVFNSFLVRLAFVLKTRFFDVS